MNTSVYLIRSLPYEFDDFPCDTYSIHKTRQGAEQARLVILAEQKEDDDTNTRDFEIVRFELKD